MALTGTRHLILLGISLLLVGCAQLPLIERHGAALEVSQDTIQRLTAARSASEELRREVSRSIPHERDPLRTDSGPSSAQLSALREQQHAYLRAREVLFDIALSHASAIVETVDASDLPLLMLRISVAELAAAELIRNVHAVSMLLSRYPDLRLTWEQADRDAGIPPESWSQAILAYRDAGYRDLFQRGLARLRQHRALLEAWTAAGDARVLALYPDGVEAGLTAIGQVENLLLAGFAEEDLGQDEREVRGLAHTSRLLRAEWTAAAPALRAAIARDGGLIRGWVHARVQEIKREYLDQREALYRLAFKHAAKLFRDDIAYPAEFRRRAIGISLVAAVTLYENARTVQTQLLPVPGVRALLNQGDPALGIPPGFWNTVEREFIRGEYRDLLRKGIQAVEIEAAFRSPLSTEEDPLLLFVAQEVGASSAASEIAGERPESRMLRGLRYQAARIEALRDEALRDGQLLLSMGFGNFVGAFEFRQGKLYGQPRWIDFLRSRLQPGDILLEKTPFRLTDRFIPGHFGHVAIYVGTEAQLRAWGLIDHPWVRRHLPEIAEGKVIVEALRDGTQLNSIEHFLNIDDLAILRPKPEALPASEVREAVVRAFSHVGKRYDFGFDTNTWDTIVCSELAFQSYLNVPWTTRRVLRAHTISPDDVAVFAGADPSRPFRLVAFVHDGRLVHDILSDQDGELLYARLLGRRYWIPTR